MAAHFRGNFRFAMLGLAVTALFVVYQVIADLQSPRSPSPAVMLTFVVLCPPSLLSLPFSDAEAGSNGFYFLWALIGILNAGLYAAVRALIVRARIVRAKTAARAKKSV